MTTVTLSASSIIGTGVVNSSGEDLGNIKELMIHLSEGHIAYVVLSHGGFLGMGDKYFAIPWEAFTIDTVNKKFVLDVPQDKLDSAPGFDKDNWPDSATHDYMTKVYAHFGYRPYWERETSLL
ncbi:MAG: PRC-barrel domain-containing protein [Saprospiraceae bacterium]|nr:PRC-barrel domain-containing protein [Saprospiraceae bacterium]